MIDLDKQIVSRTQDKEEQPYHIYTYNHTACCTFVDWLPGALCMAGAYITARKGKD